MTVHYGGIMTKPKRIVGLAGAASIVVVLNGCAGEPADQSGDPMSLVLADVLEGRIDGSTEPAAPAGALALPFDDLPTVVGDDLIGPVHPDSGDDRLRFTVISSRGDREWEVSTNPSCVGYTVSRTPSGAAVTILQSDASIDDGRLATRVAASSYDIGSGAVRWGPQAVPGSLVAPGLVFGRPTNAVVGGAGGPHEVLDGATGQPLLQVPDGVVVTERDGTIVLDDGSGAVVARQGDTGPSSWSSAAVRPASVPPDAAATLVPEGGASGAAVTTISWTWPGDPNGLVTVHRALDGALVGRPLSSRPAVMTTDAAGDVAAAVLPGGELIGLGTSGALWTSQPRVGWSSPVLDPSGTELIAMDGDEVVELDPGSGLEISRAVGLPVLLVTADGSRVLQGGAGLLLVPAGA